jgi:hypothetical protein
MNMQIILVLIASVLAFVGNIAYLKDVVHGKVRPHPYTWFIWSIVSLVTFLGGLEKGAGIGAIPTAMGPETLFSKRRGTEAWIFGSEGNGGEKSVGPVGASNPANWRRSSHKVTSDLYANAQFVAR